MRVIVIRNVSLINGNAASIKPLVHYMDMQFREYLNAEKSTSFRTEIPDNRVHCIIYFIGPNGHGYVEVA